MTAIRIVLHALLRAGVIALLIVGYDAAYDAVITPTPGDADIGKGLLAFLLVAVVSLTWGVVDGVRLRPLVWSMTWVVAALFVGVGWEIVGTSTDSIGELEPAVVAITAQFVGAPAVFGAAVAWAVSGSKRNTADPA